MNMIGGADASRGDVIRNVYSKLSQSALSKFQITVPGNHDLWDCGDPDPSWAVEKVCPNSKEDTGGWGMAQYYALDVRGSTPTSPLDFSKPPTGETRNAIAPCGVATQHDET